MDIVQMLVVILILVLLVKPLGTYIYHVFSNKQNRTDKWFNWLERIIYTFSGLKTRPSMSWKRYALSLVLLNAGFVAIGFLILLLQGYLPLNSSKIKGMEPTLAFNTIISFMTNTNLRHYSGETGLSYFSQMAVIIMMMFTSAKNRYMCGNSLYSRNYLKGRNAWKFL